MECPSCRAAVPGDARFCPSCGHALTARAEERRVITVLFADLVGFTGMSERVDPEQLKNLLDGAFQRLVDDVTSHGGRVDKIVGDQIMALFGAPTAHEDDAERAVRAGLQMQSTLAGYATEVGVAIRMRIGINSGEVLVGMLRAGGEYTAMGDTVNVASRLQTTALPGQVVVGPLTHVETAGAVRYTALPALQARGRDEPVERFVAEDTLGPAGHRPRRPRTPLIGREQEVGILCSALTMAFERRRPQFIVLSGDAGIGKSRLAEELTSDAATEHSATILEGRCVPYGEANVWWPIAAAIRQALAVDVDHTAEEARARILSKVSWGLRKEPDDPDVVRVTEGLSYLLGIGSTLEEMEPARARESAVRALVGMFHNLARHKPLVLAISELHWADDLVLDLLDGLPDRMRGMPFAMVATTRPELELRWTPKAGRHNLVALHVDPLTRAASEKLLTTLLEGSASAALTTAVLDRSGGNPFFLEELAGLVQHGGNHANLPGNLRALVAARLDNLPLPSRRILDHAAVIGRVGTMEALEALAAVHGGGDGTLRRTVDGLAAQDLFDVDFAGAGWAFRSEVVREVAYKTLTKGERARHHARLGDFLRRQAEERGREDEQLEALSHHFAMAAELVNELGGVEGVPAGILDEALRWIERAVTQAEHHEVPAVAERLCNRALELLPEHRGHERRRFLVRRAAARALLRRLDEARADVALVLPDAEEAHDTWAAAAAITVRGHVEQSEGALYDSAANLDEAIARWRRLGDKAGEANARRLRGMTDLFLGRLTSAEANIADALVLFRELDDRRGQAWAQQNMAWISTSAGDRDEARRRIDEAIRLFDEVGDLAGLAWAYGLLGWVRLQEGYLEEADELAQQVRSREGLEDDGWAHGMMALLLASTRLWLGRTEESVRLAAEARADFVAVGNSMGELRSVATMSRALLAAGRTEQARHLMAEATAMSEHELDVDARNHGNLITAGVAVQLGEAGRAFDIGRLLEAWPDGRRAPEWQILAGVALLQLGRTGPAVAALTKVFAVATQPGPLHSAGSALALAQVVDGDAQGALAVAEQLSAVAQGTYLDRINLGFARGFASLQLGREAEGRAELAEAVALADATGDRVNQALARLAQARAFEALGDAAAGEHLDRARQALGELGMTDTDWDGVFARAAKGGSAASG